MLNYKVFPRRDYSSFSEVILRSSSQDHQYAMIRDTLSAALNIDYGAQCLVQDFRYFILYVNGRYYGIYNFREKVNKNFVANQFNVLPQGANVMNNRGSHLSAGSFQPMRRLKNYINSHDMSKSASYEEVSKMLNLVSFADFWVGALFTTNNDMVNYRFANHPAHDEGRLYTVFYDLDFAFYNVNRNYIVTDMTARTLWDGSDTIISRGLMRNKRFRQLFLERISYGLHNQWNRKNILDEIDRQYSLLKPEMARECRRWGGSVSHWEGAVRDLKSFVRRRQAIMLRQVKSYFNLSNAQMRELFGDLN